VRLGNVGNTLFEIPPGEKHHEVHARKKIRRGIQLVSGWPHMHNLGKEMKVWASLPDDRAVPIVWIPEYDMHWQQIYELNKPLALPEGSYINLIAYYDNSADNPENPYDKPRTNRFGQRADDEMCYFYYYYTINAEQLTLGKPADM
jgi:hypothetical protein